MSIRAAFSGLRSLNPRKSRNMKSSENGSRLWPAVAIASRTAADPTSAKTNNKSVEHLGHNALIRSAFELDESWSLTSGIRYSGYSPVNNNLDDYDAIIVTMGLSGKF